MDIVDILDRALNRKRRKKPEGSERAELADPEMAGFTPAQRAKVAEALVERKAGRAERAKDRAAGMASKGIIGPRDRVTESEAADLMAELHGKGKKRKLTDTEVIALLRELRVGRS